MSEASTIARQNESKRRRNALAWTVLIVFGLLSLLACIVLYGEARFRGEINARHLRGQRILPEDFRWPAVPDDQNAATYLSAAADQLAMNAHQEWLIDHVDNGPLVPAQISCANRLLADKATALQAIRKARELDRVNWHVKIISPVFELTLLSHWGKQRRNVDALHLIAVAEHETGREAEAIEHIRDILGVARALEREPSGIVGHLVANALESVACDVGMRISPSVVVDSSTARDQLNALIDELLDEQVSVKGLHLGIEWDRMMMTDELRESSIRPLPRWLQRQVGVWQSVPLMHAYDEIALASEGTDWHTIETKLAHAQTSKNGFAGIALNSAPRALENQMRVTCFRRITATAMALRMYQLDHGGQWPATLQELVPRYLKSMPIDPFSPAHAAIGYLPGDPPALYSVGVNEVDDHGDRTGAMTTHGYDPWRSPDAVFPLGGVQRNEPWDPAGPSKD